MGGEREASEQVWLRSLYDTKALSTKPVLMIELLSKSAVGDYPWLNLAIDSKAAGDRCSIHEIHNGKAVLSKLAHTFS